MSLSPVGRRPPQGEDLRSESEPESLSTNSDAPNSHSHHPARDFLCLDCGVPGDCKPYTAMCLWRADRSEEPNPREVQLLYAAKDLAWKGRLPSVRELAQLMGVSPTAVSARIGGAMDTGLLERGCEQHDRRGVSLTALGEQRLVEGENRRPKLTLNRTQRRYYHLLATVRDLEVTGPANGNPVSATMLASALDRRQESIVKSLRSLARLALVRYEHGWVELTDAGRHLLETLRAYAVNVRLGPQLVFKARGRLRVQYVNCVDGRTVVTDEAAREEALASFAALLPGPSLACGGVRRSPLEEDGR